MPGILGRYQEMPRQRSRYIFTNLRRNPVTAEDKHLLRSRTTQGYLITPEAREVVGHCWIRQHASVK